MEYEYKVKMILDWSVVSTSVFVDLDEHTGNLSPEAGLKAVNEADNLMKYDFATEQNVSTDANDIEVHLVQDDDDILLEEIALPELVLGQ
jgi:hypothetical protein